MELSNFFIVPNTDNSDNKIDLCNSNREIMNLSFNNFDVNVDSSNNVINVSAAESDTISYSNINISQEYGYNQIGTVPPTLVVENKLTNDYTVSYFTLKTNDEIIINAGDFYGITNNGHSAFIGSFNLIVFNNKINKACFEIYDAINTYINCYIDDDAIINDLFVNNVTYDKDLIKSLSFRTFIKSDLLFRFFSIAGDPTNLITVDDNVTFLSTTQLRITGGKFYGFLYKGVRYLPMVFKSSYIACEFLYKNGPIISQSISTSGEGIRSYPNVIEVPNSSFDVVYDTSGLTSYVDLVFDVKHSATTSLTMNVKSSDIIKFTRTIGDYTANQVVAYRIRILKNSKGEINYYSLN